MENSTNYYEALYDVKRNFLIIGLTGYTGAGCSQCREIIETNEKPIFPSFDVIGKSHLSEGFQCESQDAYYTGKSERDRRIFDKLKRTWDETKWLQFIPIEFSVVIFSSVIYQSLFSERKNATLDAVRALSTPHKDSLQNLRLLWEDKLPRETSTLKEIIQSYETSKEILSKYKACFKNKWSFLKLMQYFGDQIRKYGLVFPEKGTTPRKDNLFKIPEAVRRLIKAHYWIKTETTGGPYHFVVDAFRNPLEIEYFKWRYSEFYLVGVLRNDIERNSSLDIQNKNFKALNKREQGNLYAKKTNNIAKWISSQNVYECLQKADLYIENKYDTSRTFSSLRFHLIKLITLAKNPGCIPPTKDERNMQIAMTAKQMSGCISRQVGATIANSKGFIAGVGWNDPPSGQTPCSLRTRAELINGGSTSAFSEYERSSAFIRHLQSNGSHNKPFCFRHELSELEGKKKKNEFTRALHAEENAFFQAIQSQPNGTDSTTLYTTSRTCTLCAKKAYQLGVKRIVYIEEYTDIAIEQTLKTGDKQIVIDRFQGITGAAFFRLYSSLIPEKDIIQLYTESALRHAEKK